MNEQKLTDWFPPEVLPACPGWYLREWDDPSLQEAADFFDGRRWFNGGYDPKTGERSFSTMMSPNVRRWRGLTEPPLTDWFGPDTPPAREGVYEIEARDGEIRVFAHWSPGQGWGAAYYAVHYGDDWAIHEAYRGRSHRGLFAPCRRWRGLAVQP